jgi:GTP-binding protein
MITIKSAEFLLGATDASQFPNDNSPEIVFVGRSNVGKSSTINHLLNRKKLAYVGRTPGKTREINFYLINEKFRFVDLPGFGYAKVALKEREKWQRYIESYFNGRGKEIKGIVHIIDLRHPGQEYDFLMRDYIDQLGCPSVLVGNKSDKLKKKEVAKMVQKTTDLFGVKPILFSAEKRVGRPELWKKIEGWI